MSYLSRKKGQSYLFEQVYDLLVQRIERREWKAHEKLPSIRQLALELQVHRLTVFKAFQQLKQQNKVYVKDKAGYYVQAGIAQEEYSDEPLVNAYPKQNLLSALQSAAVDYHLTQALIDPSLLPNQYFSDYVKKVFDLYPKVLSTYAPVEGDSELRDSLARYFTRTCRTYVSPEQLLITTGAQQAIHLIALSFLKPRDVVMLERPSYSAAIDTFRAQGAHIVTTDITESGYDMDALELTMKACRPRLFYMNPTFHNPTGAVVPADQRKRLVELAEQYRCLIIEDDTYPDIYFENKPVPPVYTFDTAESVVYIRSFSKYVSPGLRIAAVICPPVLMNVLVTAKSLADNGSPLLNQKIFLHYFESDRLQQHFDKLRIALQIRKEVMEEELSRTDWKWVSPGGGLNLWVQLPAEQDVNRLLASALERSVSFVPGSYFDSENRTSTHIRLSYSYLNETRLREGIRRLVEAGRIYN
ncbi:aminotransferase-like domain-containing protein [Paenibacillus tarimensis]|uniref:aminotransferase-like domain-containing protein n=1 Tax=Paenibacillus tarimensis TaxID=416012 RepID=UPI001F1DECA8|nr:PLP-dependent aminotransferase family protein [Paenibacillus tarimensis]MCF2943018.1 PLP-dependent aminotransferase family protein [Paenibacillus tarimensis]